MESQRPAEDRADLIGIIGAGHIGQALARTALRAGRKVVIANSRGPESLAPVVTALGAGALAGTVGEAAAADIVAIAVPWASVPAAVAGLQWNGQVVMDATNAFKPADLGAVPPARSSPSYREPSWSRWPTRWPLTYWAQIRMRRAVAG